VGTLVQVQTLKDGDGLVQVTVMSKMLMNGGEIINLMVHNMNSILGEESPFCYIGDLFDKSPVFVKIWRENDQRTNQQDVELEVTLLKRANKSGAPCPAVVEDMTALSLDVNNEVYHRLVMTRLANDNVKPSVFFVFSMSLIDSVQSLHDAGILHCDIKPSNIVWDSNTKLVSLVDFGHAQLAAVSTVAYIGTVGYTAPEVCELNKPHSFQSDAYSIGKTLLVICGYQHIIMTTDEFIIKEQMSQIEVVAKKLLRNNARARITLDKARCELLMMNGMAPIS
jgi:serine/threonine protein kinase